MRPAPFELHRPTSLAEALQLKAEYGDSATFHAGGTELLVALKARVLRYEHLIDVKQLPELRHIRLRPDGTLTLGALSTHHAIANDPHVRDLFPGYSELSEHVANIRVRAVGTIGGVLCFAEPHADAPTMLCALDARISLAGPEGRRTVPAREFHLGEFTTARRDDELLVSVDIPPAPAGARSAYRCFGHTERPAVGVAAVWSGDDSLRLGLWAGAITAIPTRLIRTEAAASRLPSSSAMADVWNALKPVLAEEAGEIEAQDDLHGSADYKRHLVSVLSQRAIEACLS
jgi:carbon-monoxide dehydrogenase medium subunit